MRWARIGVYQFARRDTSPLPSARSIRTEEALAPPPAPGLFLDWSRCGPPLSDAPPAPRRRRTLHFTDAVARKAVGSFPKGLQPLLGTGRARAVRFAALKSFGSRAQEKTLLVLSIPGAYMRLSTFGRTIWPSRRGARSDPPKHRRPRFKPCPGTSLSTTTYV